MVLVAFVVAVAALLRVSWVATAEVREPLRADAGEYARCAANLVEHGVYSLAHEVPPPPDSFRSPGYPLVLAALRLACGADHWMAAALFLQAGLGCATVLLAFALARSFLPFPAALAAAGLTALSPHLVVATGYVLTETVTGFAVALGLWLLARGLRRPDAQAPWLPGLAVGFAVLCNEALLPLPLALVWPLWRARSRRFALAFLLIAISPWLAWTARNAATDLARTGSERVVASVSHGSYPGMVFRDPRLRGFPYREDPEQPAYGSSWANLRAVWTQRAAAEPWRYAAWYLLQKPVWLWSWSHVQGRDVYVYEVTNPLYERQPVVSATRSLMTWLHVPVMLLAAATALLALRRGDATPRVLGLTAVVATLSYLPVIPDPRYLQPFRPVLFVLAAAGLCRLLALARRPAADAVAPAAAAT
jgi:hypothetical protein